MKSSNRIFWPLTLLALSLCFSVFGQVEIVEGIQYESGALLKVESLGISFTVPAACNAVLPQGSTTLVMISADQEITLLVTADEIDLESSKRDMMQVTDLGNGLSLIPAGDLWQDKNTLSGEYRVAGSPQPLRAMATATVGRHGIGVVAIMISSPSKFASGQEALERLMASYQFFERAAAIGSGATSTEEWSIYLKGKALKYFYTSNGFSSTDFIYLCSDGSFVRKLDDSSVSSLGTGVMHSGDQGTWHASGTGNQGNLVLTAPDGSQSTYELFYGEGKKGKGVYLNGSRYYVEANDRCN